jgi:hypothetical protein
MSNHHQILAEIVEKIEINRDFAISHPDYPPIELDQETITRIQQLPLQLQKKYSISRLQNYLYDLYFSHSLISLQEIAATAQQPSQIKNNTVNGVDINFYRQLRQSNPSHGYLDPDWQVVAETDAGELVVLKDGLHLHINPHQHLPRDLNQVKIGSLVPICLPPDLVGQDTYDLVGNFGIPARSHSVQIYFNFTPTAAVAIAKQLANELNKLEIPFQFAILHNPTSFYRYDAGTLWLSQIGYAAIQPMLMEIYHQHQTEFFADIPLFSKLLAPGLGVAEVPAGTATFGMHRCELLAIGLLAAMEQNQILPADKLSRIRQEFTIAGIDWLQLDLNPQG